MRIAAYAGAAGQVYRHARRRCGVIGRIGARAAVQQISACAACQQIIFGAAIQRIIAQTAIKQVDPCGACQNVDAVIARNRITKTRSGDVFNCAERIPLRIAATAGICQQVDVHANG